MRKGRTPVPRLARALAGLAACAAALGFAPGAEAISQAPDAPGYTVAGGSATVFAMARIGDTIYLGGSFTSVNGQPRSNLAAISAADGSVMSWAPAPDGEVLSLAGDASTIYIGGQFAKVGLTTRIGLASVDAASGALSSWDPNPDIGDIESLVLYGSHLYAGGTFNTMNGGAVTVKNLALFDTGTGAVNATWTPNPDSLVDAMAIQPDGSYLYVGGAFQNIGTPPVARTDLAAVKASDGTVDPAWNPADPANGGQINAVAMAPDGSQVYVTGDFFPNIGICCSMGGASRYKAAGLAPAGNGSTGAATPWAPEPDGEAYGLAATSSAVYMGGPFITVLNWNGGSVARNMLAAVDPITGQPQAWDPEPTPGGSGVNALVASPDGSVYVGGSFTAMAQAPAAVGFASFSLPPASTTAPAVTGTPQPGQTLTCVPATWSGSTPQSYSTQVLFDGAPAGPAGTQSYVVNPGDVGHTVACRDTATNRVTSTSADSAPVTIVPVPVPVQVGPPAPTGPPPPVLFKRVNIVPLSGTVLVKVPGAATFQRIQDAQSVPVGTIVDATRGVVQIVSAADALGRTQTGTFYGGLFKIVQLPGRPPITELILVGGNFKLCRAKAAAVVASGRKAARSIRHLWGQATGAFRTKGRYASASIRGTKWLTDDRCDGTLVKVVKGSVTVRDLVRRKSIVLRAVHQYLARAPAKRHG